MVDAAGREIEGHPVTFRSSAPTILTVDGDGILTSPGPLGTSTITATSGDIGAEVEAVVVLPSSALVVRPSPLSVNIGSIGALSVAVTDENGEPLPRPEFSIESDNPAVASVEVQLGDVYVYGHTLGSATLTVTSGGRTANVPVTVTQIPYQLAIAPSDLVLAPGGSRQLTAELLDLTLQPIDTSLAVTWSSSDAAVVTVTPAGLVTSVGPEGTAVFTATADTLTATLGVFVGTAPAAERLARQPLLLADGVTVLPDGRYFVTGLDTLAIGTLPDFTFEANVPIGGRASDVVVNAAGTRAYVVGARDNLSDVGVAVVDLAANAQIDFLTVGRGSPLSGSLSDDGSVLVVGTDHGIEMIDLASKTSLGGAGYGFVDQITHHPSRPLLYATVSGRAALELDAASGEIIRSFPGDVWSHAVTPDGARLYTVGITGTMGVWNLDTGAKEEGPPVTGTDLAISPDGKFLYVVYGNDHIVQGSRLSIVHRASGVRVRTLILGGLARRIGMSGDGTAIITNWTSLGDWVDFVR